MQAHLDLPPFYRILSGLPTAPYVTIAEDGRIQYAEVFFYILFFYFLYLNLINIVFKGTTFGSI